MNLRDLFVKYGSDKHLHGYHTLYEQILGDTTALLEVGVGTRNPDGVDHTVHEWFPDDYQPGGSLRAFADYLPTATITGLDTQPDCVFTDGRIVTMLCDSTNPIQVDDALEGMTFDAIIDDGDHTVTAQRRTLTALWPYLTVGGWYVIEDVATVVIPDIVYVTGFDAWRSATIVPSQSCPSGFAAIALRKCS